MLLNRSKPGCCEYKPCLFPNSNLICVNVQCKLKHTLEKLIIPFHSCKRISLKKFTLTDDTTKECPKLFKQGKRYHISSAKTFAHVKFHHRILCVRLIFYLQYNSCVNFCILSVCSACTQIQRLFN